jgi:hypothetical protein
MKCPFASCSLYVDCLRRHTCINWGKNNNNRGTLTVGVSETFQ